MIIVTIIIAPIIITSALLLGDLHQLGGEVSGHLLALEAHEDLQGSHFLVFSFFESDTRGTALHPGE